MLKTRPNFLLFVLVVTVIGITVLILQAGLNIVTIFLPRIIHFFNDTYNFCQVTGERFLEEFIEQYLVVVLVGVLFVSGGAGFYFYLLRRIRVLHRSIERNRLPLPRRLVGILQELNIPPVRIVLFKSAELRVFCTGFLQPKIYLSTGIIQALTNSELKAILAHELHHLQSYAPLRTLFTFNTVRLFHFLPFINNLTRKITLAQEIAADYFAIGVVGRKTYFQTIIRINQLNLARINSPLAGFNDLLNQRVEVLLGEKRRVHVHLIWDGLASIAIIAVLTAFAFTPFSLEKNNSRFVHSGKLCHLSYHNDCCSRVGVS